MADEDDVVDDKQSSAASGKKSGMLGSLLGIIVAIAAAIGIGLFVIMPMLSAEDEEVGDDDVERVTDEAVIRQNTKPIDFDEIMTNIKANGQFRYAKVKVQVRVWQGEDFEMINKPDVLRDLRSVMESHLATYKVQDFYKDNIRPAIAKGFRMEMDQKLRRILPVDPKHNGVFIQDITLTSLVLQ